MYHDIGIVEVHGWRGKMNRKKISSLQYHQHCARDRFCGEVRGRLCRLFAGDYVGAFFAMGESECPPVSAPCGPRLCNREGPAEERKINPASENGMDTQIKKLSVTLAPRAF